ncbi:MAG: hypothetical protein JRF63_11395 [Deltaproteobacteria bacterium]|nr:hypothetical protein [Deltaproteobacteria bacterium]
MRVLGVVYSKSIAIAADGAGCSDESMASVDQADTDTDTDSDADTDTGDGIYDSEVILDNFTWYATPVSPGTEPAD